MTPAPEDPQVEMLLVRYGVTPSDPPDRTTEDRARSDPREGARLARGDQGASGTSPRRVGCRPLSSVHGPSTGCVGSGDTEGSTWACPRRSTVLRRAFTALWVSSLNTARSSALADGAVPASGGHTGLTSCPTGRRACSSTAPPSTKDPADDDGTDQAQHDHPPCRSRRFSTAT